MIVHSTYLSCMGSLRCGLSQVPGLQEGPFSSTSSSLPPGSRPKHPPPGCPFDPSSRACGGSPFFPLFFSCLVLAAQFPAAVWRQGYSWPGHDLHRPAARPLPRRSGIWRAHMVSWDVTDSECEDDGHNLAQPMPHAHAFAGALTPSSLLWAPGGRHGWKYDCFIHAPTQPSGGVLA